MTADALAHCTTRASVTIVLAMQDEWLLVFVGKDYIYMRQLSVEKW